MQLRSAPPSVQLHKMPFIPSPKTLFQAVVLVLLAHFTDAKSESRTRLQQKCPVLSLILAASLDAKLSKTSGLDLPSPCPYCHFLLNHTVHSRLPPQSWLQGHQGHSLSPASPFQRALTDLIPLKPSLLDILLYPLAPLSAYSLFPCLERGLEVDHGEGGSGEGSFCVCGSLVGRC